MQSSLTAMNELEKSLGIDGTLLSVQLVLLAALFACGVLYLRGLCRALPLVWRSCRGWVCVFWIAVVILLPIVGAILARLALADGPGIKPQVGKPRSE